LGNEIRLSYVAKRPILSVRELVHQPYARFVIHTIRGVVGKEHVYVSFRYNAKS
jgi:hypothetical protein